MLFILMLNVILLPVAIAFFHDAVHPGWLSFNCISDFIFFVDIVLNFWTGVITDENLVILELPQIRKLYVRKWLILDIISIFPFDYIVLIIFQSNDSVDSILHASLALRLLRLLKLLSLLRLFRVVRFLHYLSKWEEVNNKSNYYLVHRLWCRKNHCSLLVSLVSSPKPLTAFCMNQQKARNGLRARLVLLL